MKRSPWQHRIPSLLVSILLTLGARSVHAVIHIPSTERTALIDLYNSTNGASWTTSTNWNGAVGTECTWYGVTCNGSPSVTKITLLGNNLTGSLPSDLSNLTNLVTFIVAQNHLTGSIPALTGLTNLGYFYVNNNHLTGSIPALTGLTNLVEFDVDTNQLTGSIPALTGLTNLNYFDVDTNQLTGSIPALTGLTNLGYFNLESNQLTGSIPALTGLTNLGTFFVDNNQLTGSIPALTGLTNLVVFFVETNQLTGSIPALTGLTNLIVFHVRNNLLTGNVPAVPSSLISSGGASLCPNYLNHTPDSNWDAATGVTPWYTDCTAAPIQAAPAPALSHFALAGTCLLLLGIGAWSLRRTRAAA